jgi:hypothetical protein
MGRFQEFTFGELASLGSGFQKFQGFNVSGFQCFRVIARRDEEATKVSMFQCFSVSKGFRLLKVCDIAERHMALYTEHSALFTIHFSLFAFHFSLSTQH